MNDTASEEVRGPVCSAADPCDESLQVDVKDEEPGPIEKVEEATQSWSADG